MSDRPDLIRRTSHIVADAEASASFYEAIFGWTRFYDNDTPVDARFPPCAPDGTTGHIIILKAEDPFIGMIGFMEYRDFTPEDRRLPDRESLGIGDSITVIEAKNIAETHERAKNAGARIVTEPVHWTVTSHDGKGVINLATFGFFDPDGRYIEVNSRLD